MANVTEEQNQHFNELLLQLDGIARLANYRNEDFNNSSRDAQEELCELFSALIRLKKLTLTDNRALSLEINEFVNANFQLSEEFKTTSNMLNKLDLI
ncbi:MAG: hypothetical protein V4501_03000 [Pseudomonadota bacterium]